MSSAFNTFRQPQVAVKSRLHFLVISLISSSVMSRPTLAQLYALSHFRQPWIGNHTTQGDILYAIFSEKAANLVEKA